MKKKNMSPVEKISDAGRGVGIYGSSNSWLRRFGLGQFVRGISNWSKRTWASITGRRITNEILQKEMKRRSNEKAK